jgi:hypothetical protein
MKRAARPSVRRRASVEVGAGDRRPALELCSRVARNSCYEVCMRPRPRHWSLVVALLPALVAGACSSGSSRDAYAVGSMIGVGSPLIGATDCTYEAKPAVAELAENHRVGTLVGAGEVVQTCGEAKTTIDVLKPTGAKITGPAKIAVGVRHGEPFRVSLRAGERELRFSNPVDWSLGTDCAGKAAVEPDTGAQDTGRDVQNLWLRTEAKGACTVVGEVLGQQAELLVTIE